MLIFSFFIVLGIGFESVAVYQLYLSFWPIWEIVSIHFLATLSTMTAIHHFKKSYRQYNFAIITMLFMLMFFIPALGLLGSLFLARWLRVAQNRPSVPKVQFMTSYFPFNPLRTSYGIGGARVALNDTRVSISKRITALNILSTIPTNMVNNLVRTVLPDKDYELRLLAFYLLNQQEKKLVPEISKAIDLLANENNPKKMFFYQKLIALQLWELVYQSLVEPHLINFVLQQALSYATLALHYDQNNSALWFLSGRILNRQKKFPEAITTFNRAINCGLPERHATPYLAEAYFYQRQFHRIGPLFKNQSTIPSSIISQGIIDFWSVSHD